MIKINCLQSITKKITCIALGIIITTNVMVAGEGPKADATSIEGKAKLFLGFGLGVRTISNSGSAVYFDGDKVEFGSTKPVAFAIFGQYQTKKNLVLHVSVEGFSSKTRGAGFHIAGGYKISKGKFAIVPLIGVGFGSAKTELDKYKLYDNVIELNNGSYWVGPLAANYGRGVGSDISLDISTGLTNIKPAVQAQLGLKKVTIFAELGYVIAISSKAKMTLNGKGYKTEEEYSNSTNAPQDLSIEGGKLEDYLTDANDNPSNNYPVKFSGVSFLIGIGFNLR